MIICFRVAFLGNLLLGIMCKDLNDLEVFLTTKVRGGFMMHIVVVVAALVNQVMMQILRSRSFHNYVV